jgi:hypothetical protein
MKVIGRAVLSISPVTVMVDANVGSAWSPKDSNAAPVLVLHRLTKTVEDPSTELADERVRLKIGISPRPTRARVGVRVRIAAGDDSRTAEAGVVGNSAGSGMVATVVPKAAGGRTVSSAASGNLEGNKSEPADEGVNLVPTGTRNVVPLTTVSPSPGLNVRSTEEDGWGRRRIEPLDRINAAFNGAVEPKMCLVGE